MTEARIGRLLPACLHQAIGDVLPERMDFYELWLRSEGLRDGSIGLGPLTAVLGFRRTEHAYGGVVTRAGRLAGEWTVASMTPLRRRAIGWLPRPLRARVALRVVAAIVEQVCTTSLASPRVRRRAASLDVTASLFCTVRETQAQPLCGFYAAAATEVLALFGLPARAQLERCRAVDGATCVIAIEFIGADAVAAA